MEKYKKILIGKNSFSKQWNILLNSPNFLKYSNIIICDFYNSINLKNIILNKNVDYILPLSDVDYNLIHK